MTERRQKILDRMIKIYGFEHQLVIDYATLCENFPQEEWADSLLLEGIMNHEKNPKIESDE